MSQMRYIVPARLAAFLAAAVFSAAPAPLLGGPACDKCACAATPQADGCCCTDQATGIARQGTCCGESAGGQPRACTGLGLGLSGCGCACQKAPGNASTGTRVVRSEDRPAADVLDDAAVPPVPAPRPPASAESPPWDHQFLPKVPARVLFCVWRN
jgi:hypothetical protein